MLFKLSFLMILLISFLMLKMVNPFMMTMMVILTSLFMSIFLSLFSKMWVIYSILLMFLGGMMIIFLYLGSLSFNEKFKQLKMNFFIMVFFFYCSLNIKNDFLEYNFENLKIMFNIYGGENLFFVTLILLLTLLVVVKMVKIFLGPLKQKFF